jgi:serine/threonine protein kinase/tetratricopeptide (TPR) repeat protein
VIPALGRFWSELGRRKVTRVAVAYLVVAWAAVEVADTVFPHLSLPAWSITLVIAMVALGFPVSLVAAWAYDVTPDGVRRTEPLPPAQWQRVQDALGAALELPPGDRAAFLQGACADAPEVRREVESLLAAHDRAGVLDRPAPFRARTAEAPGGSPPSLLRNAPHYELLDRVGGGGMGVVYRARDRRLDRIVALKFLPPHLSADERAMERFLVEAQSAAALDHPNICTIFEAGQTDDGHLFLAMPYYEGETLRRRLEAGPLPVAECLDLAIQVANGLARAHDRGIVHRDIKPANLVLTSDGLIKIVDFGVAKLADAEMTRPGDALGTIAYMSPEQAEGDEVDARSDLWSLGVVLYEMLAGQRPFRGPGDRTLLNSIFSAEPPRLQELRPDLPPGVEEVVLRALAKRRTDRYETAREMAAALESLRAGSTASASGRTGPGGPRTGGGVTGLATGFSGPTAGDTTSGGLLPDGERRQVTVVVSQIAGYDEFVEQLVPDRLRALLERVHFEAEQVATAHGGLLNKFGGDQLALLFGVPTTREDDAVRATRAALELHERLGLTEDATPVELHTGIDTGSVVAHGMSGGDRLFHVAGAPPHVATRLAENAETAGVWLSGETKTAVSPWFEVEAGEPIAMRGRRQSLVPWRVLRQTGLQSRMEASERVGLTAFTGRDRELATLHRCLEDALDGDGQLVTVTGDPGLGKSRLLHEFRHALQQREVRVLMGRCQSYGGGVAYLPFIEILRDGLGLSDAGDVEVAAARIRAISPTLEEFIPLYLHLLSIRTTAYPVPRHLHGDAFRLAMQEALAAILTLGAPAVRTAIVLEDWHWADEASQAVLRQVAEVLGGHPLLVLVTSRPGYGVDLGPPGQFTHIALKPLQQAATTAMLRSVLRVDVVSDTLVSLIHERTGGNPFFIEEICHALLEQNALAVADGAAELSDSPQRLDLPDSIQAVIRARLDRLDREVRDVLRLAAVIGREFSRSVLERALPTPADLAAALDTLKATGLIQQTRVAPDPAYHFKHVLTQEVAYATLLEHQRRDLHERVGLIIEELEGEHADDRHERLAHHFSRAERWDRAVAYGLRSAEAATGLAQFSQALQVLERTQRWIARLPAGAERDRMSVDVLFQLERLCETLGQRPRQQQLIDQLIAVLTASDDRGRLAEAYLRQGDLFTLLRRFAEADAALQESLRLRRDLGDRDGERNTLRSLGLLRWHEGRNAEALVAAEETLRIDRERGDNAAIVGDMANCGAILRALGEHDRAQRILEQALEVGDFDADGSGGPDADELAIKHVYVLQHLANIHRERDDRTRALECLRRAGEIAEEKRLPIQLAYHYTSVAHLLLQEGQVEDSLRYYCDAIELSRRARHASGLAASLAIYGDVLVGLGRVDEALPPIQEAAATYAELRDAEGEARAWRAVAEAEERLGRLAPAMAAWGKASQLLRQLGDHAGELLAVEGLARTTRAHVAEPTLALAQYERAADLAAALGDDKAEGRIRNVMGIIEWNRGQFGEALSQYERSLQLFRDSGDTGAAALMLNSIGATLRALGQPVEAEQRLQEALELHRGSAPGQLEGHALALLAEIRMDTDDAAGGTEYYSRSLDIRRAIGDRRGEGWMLHGLARCELARGIPYLVREHATAAARIAEECGDGELATACEQLRRIAD